VADIIASDLLDPGYIAGAQAAMAKAMGLREQF
jgi:hypothetical protein